MESTQADRELVKSLEGFYVGSLETEEIESLDRCVEDGVATRDYDYPGGLLGLAKVKCHD